jgi:hypothetical protein
MADPLRTRNLVDEVPAVLLDTWRIQSMSTMLNVSYGN